MADKQFRDGQRVGIGDVADATGIHRTTLSKLVNQRSLNTTTELLEKLCAYFEVGLGDVAEFVPDQNASKQRAKKSIKKQGR